MKFASCCRMRLDNEKKFQLKCNPTIRQWWYSIMNAKHCCYTISLFIVVFSIQIGLHFFSPHFRIHLNWLAQKSSRVVMNMDHAFKPLCIKTIVHRVQCIHNRFFLSTFFDHFSVVLKHFDNCLLVEHSWSVHHLWKKQWFKHNTDCIVKQASKKQIFNMI